MTSTALYTPYKSIGLVTDGNPFVINRLGEEIFLVLSIGKTFQILRFDRLTTCLVSRTAPGKIQSLQAIGHDIFAAIDRSIYVYNRSDIVRKYDIHSCRIKNMLIVGKHLISYDHENNVKIIDTQKRQEISHVKMIQKAEITCIIHPPTYINKFVVSFTNGDLELWNFNKKSLVHSFKSHLLHLKKNNKINSSNNHVHIVDGKMMINNQYQSEHNNYNIAILSQSPACDIIAIGFVVGDIILLNLLLDVVLFSFKQDGGAVTAITFRTDIGSEKYPYMVSGSLDGRLHVWNLGNGKEKPTNETDLSNMIFAEVERKLLYSINEAHNGTVSNVSFLYGEPVMISNGIDNSIKVWIFDSSDGTARLLKSRQGHQGTPLRIRYYGGMTNVSMRDSADAMSCEIISSGIDGSVRLFNTSVENQNRELSQKPILKKLGLQRRNERLPECNGFDFNESRQRDWGNMITIHKNHTNAYVWNYKNRVVTDMILKQPSWNTNEMKQHIDRRTHASAVAISQCGNFCMVGSKGGMIYRYNIQSGLTRGSFPNDVRHNMNEFEKKKNIINRKANIPGNVYNDEKVVRMMNDNFMSTSFESDNTVKVQMGHHDEVTGLFVDMMNMVLVSCGLDGLLIFWDFNNHQILKIVDHNKVPLIRMQGFRDGNFVAIVSVDNVVRVYDVSTCKLSRRFEKGHKREITDVCFSMDGRRLLTSSIDCTLRVWDMPTGRCLSWLLFESPIASITVSLSSEFLVISFMEKDGLYMYIDRSLYETIHFWKEPQFPSPINDSELAVDLESSLYDNDLAELLMNNEDEDDVNGTIITAPQPQTIESSNQKEDPKPKSKYAITMSSIPRAYWTSLFHLEAIKERSKPKLPPAAPVAAPFFLPTVIRGGSTPSFPTPQEFEKLSQNLLTNNSSVENVDVKIAENVSLETIESNRKKTKYSDQQLMSVDGRVNESNKKSKHKNNEEENEDEIAFQIGQMGSVWNDDVDNDDNNENEDKVDWFIDTTPSHEPLEIIDEKEEPSVENKKSKLNKISSSRIFTKRTAALPRCKLVAYLSQHFPIDMLVITIPSCVPSTANPQDYLSLFSQYESFLNSNLSFRTTNEPIIIEYLTKLSPPAIDLEFRSLFINEQDEEGFVLLRQFLLWLELILKNKQLQNDINNIQDIQKESIIRFRNVSGKDGWFLAGVVDFNRIWPGLVWVVLD
eukprot:gene10444-14028_t